MILANEFVFVTHGLYCLVVDDGVTAEQIGVIVQFFCLFGQTFLELHSDPVADHDEGSQAQTDEGLLPTEIEAHNKSSKECKARLSIRSKTLRACSVDL